MLVTAIIGSYRKGNTYNIVRQIEARLQQLGDVDFKYIFLTEANLMECKGCFTCIGKGETLCPLKDDLLGIEKQLLESDGVIFASPNYACGVTAQMKRLIERFAYIGHRPKFFGNYAALVTTSAGPVGLRQTLQDLSYFAGGGFTIVSKLGLMTPPFSRGSKTEKKNLTKINSCADRLFFAIQAKKSIQPSFAGILQFASFRALYLANSKHGERYFPADMKYWREKGWLDKGTKYYLNIKVNPIKRLFGLLFEKIIRLASKHMIGEA